MGYTHENAAKLDEIEFPAFTTKLIGDTFDTLVAANIKQIDTYKDLLKTASLSLTEYINQTQDDFGPTAIMEYLGTINLSTGSALELLPNKTFDPETGTVNQNVGTTALTIPQNDSSTLNNALSINGTSTPHLP